MTIKKHTIWNLVGAGAPLAIGIVAIPYLLKSCGVEIFGVLTLVWTLIGYFGLFDFGLGRALTQVISKSIGAGDFAGVTAKTHAAIKLTLYVGLIGMLLLGALAYPMGTVWLNVSVGVQSDVIWAVLIAALGVPVTTVTSGLRGFLEAYEDFKTANILRIILGVLNFVMPVVVVFIYGPSLIVMVVGIGLSRLLVLYLHYLAVNKLLPVKGISSELTAESAKELLVFGSWMSLSNLISPLMVYADRFLISAVLGAGVVAYYTVPFEVIVRFLVLPGALAAALFPRFSMLLVANTIEAKKIYHKAFLLTSLAMLGLCLPVMLFSDFALTIWLGAEFSVHAGIAPKILALGVLFNGIAMIPFAVIQAAGRAKITALIHTTEFFIYIPTLFYCVTVYGITGAAIAWCVRVVIDFSLLTIFAHLQFKKAS